MTQQAATKNAIDPQRAYRALLQAGDIQSDPEQARVVTRLQKLHTQLIDYPEVADRAGGSRFWRLSTLFTRQGGGHVPKGLYLYGGVGRGKSMLMDMFFDNAPVRNKRRVHFHAFMAETHARMKRWRGLSGQDRIREGGRAGEDDPISAVARQVAREASLLCFDEFQVTDVADAMILGRLFGELFNWGVIVVATSNRIPDALYEDGLNRQLFLPFIDLLKSKLDVVALNGPTDYRLDRVSGMGSYFVPISPENTNRMQRIFWRLTGLSPDDRAMVPTGTVEVQGRTIFVPKAVGGIAVFSFKRLCQNPLGASDYLAIAQKFHTIFMVGIPVMDASMRNEAKRFVTLIDALYESRVKFFCMAAAAPAALYREGDGAFEFERTASRLMEMQSDDYFAKDHLS